MLVSTPAIVLHAFPYGETSKIVRLSTRDHGVQSVIAKGAARARSRFGVGLRALSEGEALFYLKPHRDLQTLSAFDATDVHAELGTDVRRYAAAAALAELVMRCAPSEPHAEIFDVLRGALRRLAAADATGVSAAALAALWHGVAVLGFAPVVDACARCGSALPARAPFSLADGGLLCARCGAGARRGALSETDRAALAAFLQGVQGGPALPRKHLLAHARLVARFVRRHLAEDRDLPALAFWESLA